MDRLRERFGRDADDVPAVYRVEDGAVCIDIHLHTAQQLFDNRDPAPFRDRDLDGAAASYLYDAATDIPLAHPIRLVVFLAEHPQDQLGAAIPDAVHTHFAYVAARTQRQLREQRRLGRAALAVGLTVLVGFLTLGEFVRSVAPGHAGEIVREGLVITGWVAMWRPIEVLFYDWWPLVEERRQASRLAAARVDVRVPPATATG